MTRRTRIALTLLLTVAFWALVVPAAGAYIDAGTGSYLIQVIIGVFAGAALAVAAFWRRIWAFFSSRGRKKQGPAEES